MSTKQEFVEALWKMFNEKKEPIGSTWYWQKCIYGKGYDRPEGYKYRKTLMALNELKNANKIEALRTNDVTIWYLPYKDYKGGDKE